MDHDRAAIRARCGPRCARWWMLGVNYGPAGGSADNPQSCARAAPSRLRPGDDYHELIKPRLKSLRALNPQFGGDIKVFVDTAGSLARRRAAPPGRQARRSRLAPWLFLGAIRPRSSWAPDRAVGRPLRHLPRLPRHLPRPAPFRRRIASMRGRCISYLTIEHKGPIQRDLRPLMGNRIYRLRRITPWLP